MDRDDKDLQTPRPTASEAALLARAQHGDAAAFEQLVAPYRLSLVRFCWWYLKDADLAEHTALVAEERAWFNVANCRGAFRPWLMAIARRAALDALKSAEYQRTVPLLAETPAPVASAEGSFENNVILYQDLEAAIARLTPREQELLELLYFAGLSYSEVAEVLRVDPASARELGERAIVALRDDRAAQRVADYSEAVARGLPADAGGLDPADAALIRALHALSIADLPSVALLPAHDQAVITLRDQMHLAWNEVAEILEIPPAQARNDYKRALEALKALIIAQAAAAPADAEAELAALVRQRREAAGLSQEALAKRVGLSIRGIRDLERGV
ncbi:MAG: sigma-70 family RNA polymerase sigma factor [Thermomicrobiales bacterium]